jgi:hypothetical protein
MLFTDGPAVTIDHLAAEDSTLLATAQSVGINVSEKLYLAMAEVQSELETLLQRLEPRTPRINQVVITPELARWEKMQALAMVYRDASYTQMTDRYKPKWDMFAELEREAVSQFIANGVGVVDDPVPQALIPTLGTVTATGSSTQGTFYACITWLNAKGQQSSPSMAGSLLIPVENLMTITAIAAPPNAAGFNVYAGADLLKMTLQNTAGAVPVGSIFTWQPGTSVSTQLPGTGQAPDYTRALPARIQRG